VADVREVRVDDDGTTTIEVQGATLEAMKDLARHALMAGAGVDGALVLLEGAAQLLEGTRTPVPSKDSDR
jgi:hypothetical protein